MLIWLFLRELKAEDIDIKKSSYQNYKTLKDFGEKIETLR